jgi:hypothetical protein
MTGRGTIYMGSVSSSLIGLGFLAQVVTRLEPFVAAVRPAVCTQNSLPQRIPLRTYLDYRLGRNQPWWRQTWNVLVQPLAAPSLAEFWRTWNPVWSYYLSS